MLKAGAPVEPIVLRAAAGECMVVTLRNRLPAIAPDLAGYQHLPGIVTRDVSAVRRPDHLQQQPHPPLQLVGLHPSLVAFDVAKDNGTATGQNGLGSNGSGLLALPARPRSTAGTPATSASSRRRAAPTTSSRRRSSSAAPTSPRPT